MSAYEDIQDLFDDANGHLAVGEFDEAIPLYRRCVAIDPTFFDGWHALGMALLKTGHVKEAIGCGLQSVTLQPNDLLAWTSLSQMYVRPHPLAGRQSREVTIALASGRRGVYLPDRLATQSSLTL